MKKLNHTNKRVRTDLPQDQIPMINQECASSVEAKHRLPLMLLKSIHEKGQEIDLFYDDPESKQNLFISGKIPLTIYDDKDYVPYLMQKQGLFNRDEVKLPVFDNDVFKSV